MIHSYPSMYLKHSTVLEEKQTDRPSKRKNRPILSIAWTFAGNQKYNESFAPKPSAQKSSQVIRLNSAWMASNLNRRTTQASETNHFSQSRSCVNLHVNEKGSFAVTKLQHLHWSGPENPNVVLVQRQRYVLELIRSVHCTYPPGSKKIWSKRNYHETWPWLHTRIATMHSTVATRRYIVEVTTNGWLCSYLLKLAWQIGLVLLW